MPNLKKMQLLKTIESCTDGDGIDETRKKLSLLLGYYVGYSSKLDEDNYEDLTPTQSFNLCWSKFETIVEQFNEIRPIDFELVKSTAQYIMVVRLRLLCGGLSNVFIPSGYLDVLDLFHTTEKLLGKPVTHGQLTEFWAAMDACYQ